MKKNSNLLIGPSILIMSSYTSPKSLGREDVFPLPRDLTSQALPPVPVPALSHLHSLPPRVVSLKELHLGSNDEE